MQYRMKELSAALPQNLVNTITSADEGKWTPCPRCSSEVRPIHIKDGRCFQCEEGESRERTDFERRRRHLAALLGGERGLTFSAENFIETPENQEAFEAARQFREDVDNLYLFGDCGTGKTHLACMIARACLEAGRRAAYIQPGRMLRSIRGKSGNEEQQEIDRLAGLDVLVLDDLGAEKDTEYAVQILYEVVDGRVMGFKNGLVVTSNLALPELASKLGDDRLPSRLSGICRVVHVGGGDWRLPTRDGREGLPR